MAVTVAVKLKRIEDGSVLFSQPAQLSSIQTGAKYTKRLCDRPDPLASPAAWLAGPPSVLVQLVRSWTHTAQVDGQDVGGVPAAGKDQLLYSDEVEENLPPKAGEEEGREWSGWAGVIVYLLLQIFPDAR